MCGCLPSGGVCRHVFTSTNFKKEKEKKKSFTASMIPPPSGEMLGGVGAGGGSAVAAEYGKMKNVVENHYLTTRVSYILASYLFKPCIIITGFGDKKKSFLRRRSLNISYLVANEGGCSDLASVERQFIYLHSMDGWGEPTRYKTLPRISPTVSRSAESVNSSWGNMQKAFLCAPCIRYMSGGKIGILKGQKDWFGSVLMILLLSPEYHFVHLQSGSHFFNFNFQLLQFG